MNMKADHYGPKHYRTSSIQPWTYITSHNMQFCEGNVVKYITRWREPSGGGLEDLRKAKHYLQKLIDLETQDRGDT